MEFHGENGKPLKTSVKGLRGLKQLSIVTIKGKIHKDRRGNVSVVAQEMHVQD